MAEDRSVLSRHAEPGTVEPYADEHPDQVLETFSPPDEPAATVVFFHGGFWRPEFDRAHVRPACHALRDAGYRAIAVEYRRGGDYYETLDDVYEALLHVAATEADEDQPIILAGHSAGGQLALYAEDLYTPDITATPLDGGSVLVEHDTPIAGVVALAPITDTEACHRLGLGDGAAAAFLGGSPEEVPEHYRDTTCDSPQTRAIVIHGEADTRVPIGMSREYVARTGSTVLRELPGIAHFELIDPLSSAWPTVLAAIDELAPGGGT